MIPSATTRAKYALLILVAGLFFFNTLIQLQKTTTDTHTARLPDKIGESSPMVIRLKEEVGAPTTTHCGPSGSFVDLTPKPLSSNEQNKNRDFGYHLDQIASDPRVRCDSVRVDLNDYTLEQTRDLLQRMPLLVNKRKNKVIFVVHRAGPSHANNKLLSQLTSDGQKYGSIARLEKSVELDGENKWLETVELEFVFFTGVVLGYNVERLHNMKSMLNVYLKHPGLHQLHFVWNNLNESISFQQLTLGVTTDENLKHKIQLRLASKNSLNNRFVPRLDIETNAIFVFDDDHVINLDRLSTLFKAWQEYPERLIGLVPRVFDGEYRFISDSCNIILPIKCFFDRKYLDEYWSWKHYELRKYVNHQEAHCDDIALNYIISMATGEPHVLVSGMDPTSLRSSGAISSQNNRGKLRTECSAWISQYFGGKILPVVQVVNQQSKTK